MRSLRQPPKPPTESELELAHDWTLTSRLIEESIFLRLDFDPRDIKNPKERYAPMKWLLNDDHVRYMQNQLDCRTARAFRRQRRGKYQQLLAQLREDVARACSDRLGDIEQGGCWREYGSFAWESLQARACLALLRTAHLLHWFHLPGPAEMARRGCDLVRYSALPELPRRRIVPIR